MKKIFIIILIISFKISALAQKGKCSCSSVFENLIQKLEENYIALEQLKNTGNSTLYNKRKNDFKKKSKHINSEYCTAFLQNFLSYFNDGHLFVYEQPTYYDDEILLFKAKIKNDKISTGSLTHAVKFDKNITESTALDGMTGYWTDGMSQIAVIKDKGYYKAYIINSTQKSVEAGELKATFSPSSKGFKGTYYSYNYSPKYIEGNIYKDNSLIVLTGGIYWARLDSPEIGAYKMTGKFNPSLPIIRKLDDENVLFSIPSFLVDYQEFVKIITDNIDILKNAKNLIIDIRGNIGGNAIYFTFIDLYANQPLRSSQGLVLASNDTKLYFERLSQNSPEVYGPVVERIKNNIGRIIDGPAYPEKIFEPFESKVEQVAILTDHGCMSAAESFILHSKGVSTKVKTFGSPTGGVIDYTSVNTLRLESGTQNIYFGYPTSTYHKEIPLNGYNNTGIIPDVKIPKDVKDKVAFIVNYLVN